MATEEPPLQSLRRAIEVRSPVVNNALAFAAGTEYSSTFTHPPGNAYGYTPLPETVATPSLYHQPPTAPISHLGKTGPMELWHPTVSNANQVCDSKGTGFLHQQEVKNAIRRSGVFLTEGEVSEVMKICERNGMGEVNWTQLVDQVRGIAPDTTWKTSTGLMFGRPLLPPSFEWSEPDQTFEVCLRLRPDTSVPHEFSGSQMCEFAKKMTKIRQHESNAEKVHDLMRYQLLQDLIISPGKPGAPDMTFRNWMSTNGLMSITSRQYSGPYPPEVYDVFDQIIYNLGLPIVLSSTMTLTAMGGSMRHMHQ
eukprot:gene17559-23883_t